MSCTDIWTVCHWRPPYGILDRFQVWERHAYSEVRRVSKPGPDPAFPTYVVGERSAMRLASVPANEDVRIAGSVSPTGVADCVEGVGLPMIAGTTLPTDVAKQVADDAASLADAGILLQADSVGTLSLSDHAGMLFPIVLAGIPFPAGPDQDGTLSPTDPARILFPADPAGMLFPAVPAGIPFPAGSDQDGTFSPTDPAGILFPADPAGILFPAYLAEQVTLGVAGSADTGILFPAIILQRYRSR